MKINAENLLGNASKISAKRTESSVAERSSSENRSDRADIASKVDSRLDSIQNEMRELQTNISQNQVIKEGLSRMMEAAGNGDSISSIINDTKFENRKVLADFLDQSESATKDNPIVEHNKILESRITSDTNRLTKLFIETENIFASNLGKNEKSMSVQGYIDKMMEEAKSPLSDITVVNPDKVMRLIK